LLEEIDWEVEVESVLIFSLQLNVPDCAWLFFSDATYQCPHLVSSRPATILNATQEQETVARREALI
jgi:hypothetical protein